MAKRSPAIAFVGTAVALVALVLTYRRLLRQTVMTWGARPDEALRDLPGDELLESADIISTRAITIGARPAAVWPWLVQMGSGRGGAYTYDWIENLLGLDMQSADRILPEFQKLEVGDVVPNKKGGPGMRVEMLEAERVLSWHSEDGNWVWTFVLVEEEGATRLISRNRIKMGGALGGRLAMLVMEPGSLLMERKMLLGIKQRAEKLVRAEEGAGAPNGRQPVTAG